MIDFKFEAYSIVGIVILIAGILRLYIYYKFFHISIIPFIEPGEILTAFFDNLLYFLCFLGLNIIVLWGFYERKVDTNTILPDTTFCQRLILYEVFRLNKIILLLVLSVALFCVSKCRNSKYFYEFYLWILLLIIAIYINPTAIFESENLFLKSNIIINETTVIFLISAINLMVFSSISGYNESFKVKRRNFYIKTEFELENSPKIISTKDYYYIGKTKQFAFFYDRNKQETDVIPVSKFTKMKFGK